MYIQHERVRTTRWYMVHTCGLCMDLGTGFWGESGEITVTAVNNVKAENQKKKSKMAEDPLSTDKKWQIIFTYSIGGLVTAYFWKSLDTISRGVILLFAAVAASSIRNGTWMMNSRELRKQEREERREAFRQAKTWVTGRE